MNQPVEKPFGVWLPLSVFSLKDASVLKHRALPVEGDFHLVPFEWLVPEKSVAKKPSRVQGSEQTEEALEEPLHDDWNGLPTKPKKKAKPSAKKHLAIKAVPAFEKPAAPKKYTLKGLSDENFFQTTDHEGNPTLGIHLAPLVIVSTSPRHFRRSLEDFLEEILDHDNDRDSEEISQSNLDQLRQCLESSSPPHLVLTGVSFSSSEPVPVSGDPLTYRFLKWVVPGWYTTNSDDTEIKIVFYPGNHRLPNDALKLSPEESFKLWGAAATESSIASRKSKLLELKKFQNKIASIQREIGCLDLVIKSAGAEIRRRVLAAMTAITEDERVDSVSIGSLSLTLVTKDVWVTHPHEQGKKDTKYFLGKFSFSISLENGVSVRNLKQPSTADRFHPHGYTDGVCLGTYESVFGSCYRNFDYHLLFLTLLEWAWDINPGDSRACRSLGDHFPKKVGKITTSQVIPFLESTTAESVNDEDYNNTDEENPYI